MSNSIEVTITPDDLRAQPGAEVEAVIEVTNAGRILDFYSIEITGVADGWWHLPFAHSLHTLNFSSR